MWRAMSTRVSTAALAVLIFTCLCACSSQLQPEAPQTPQVQLDTPFSLAYEQTVAISDTPLRLTFVKLIGDSRCPEGVECFWAGSADIEVKVTSGAESTLIQLSTYHQDKREASAFGYRIQLEDVTPHPAEGRKIEASQYVAHLKVTPLPKD